MRSPCSSDHETTWKSNTYLHQKQMEREQKSAGDEEGSKKDF